GESGAGKTMNANFIIDYIQKSTFQGSSPRLQTIKKIIRSSVGLLEAMGNAKTIRNNNSSRFGKLLEIRFNAANEISGSHITPFMLETARITNVTENNRSFHIFYQLIAVNNQYTEGLGMEDVSHFKYLRDGLTIADNINDVEGFEETLTALKDINISDEDIKSFFQIIAGVAHLGNIEFEAISDSESRVANRDGMLSYRY
ncbi:MAG: Unconventional myosin-Ie, partial [Paramarteilia canceri]